MSESSLFSGTQFIEADHLIGVQKLSPHDGNPVVLVTLLVCFFTFARYTFQYFIQEISKHYLSLNEKGRLKFSESCWKLSYYVIVTFWGIGCVLSSDFFWETRLCWENWPNIPWSESFHNYYLVQLAFYIHSIIAHFTVESKRKDFYQMLIHHVITVALIGWSIHAKFYRIGGVVMLLHDVNDIFLELAKLLKYIRWEKTAHFFLVSLVLCWGWTRIYLFPSKVLYSTAIESWGILGSNPEAAAHWIPFNSLLSVVFLLNLFWFIMMLKLIFRFVFKKEYVGDVREKDE